MAIEPNPHAQAEDSPPPGEERSLRHRRKKHHEIYATKVVDNRDPESLGRVKVKLPWLPDGSAWARLATLTAGDRRGSWFIPEVNDEVVVAFDGGDPERPYVLGSLWSALHAPPATMDSAGDNALKLLRSRSGLQITLVDKQGEEAIIIETPEGQKITLQDKPSAIELTDSNGNALKLEATGITIQAAAKITLSASALEISASLLTVNAGMARFSGVIQTDTLIANSVISASYSPGAGNIA